MEKDLAQPPQHQQRAQAAHADQHRRQHLHRQGRAAPPAIAGCPRPGRCRPRRRCAAARPWTCPPACRAPPADRPAAGRTAAASSEKNCTQMNRLAVPAAISAPSCDQHGAQLQRAIGEPQDQRQGGDGVVGLGLPELAASRGSGSPGSSAQTSSASQPGPKVTSAQPTLRTDAQIVRDRTPASRARANERQRLCTGDTSRFRTRIRKKRRWPRAKARTDGRK